MENNEKKTRGPGRPKVENGKRHNIVTTEEELKLIYELLHSIRDKKK